MDCDRDPVHGHCGFLTDCDGPCRGHSCAVVHDRADFGGETWIEMVNVRIWIEKEGAVARVHHPCQQACGTWNSTSTETFSLPRACSMSY